MLFALYREYNPIVQRAVAHLVTAFQVQHFQTVFRLLDNLKFFDKLVVHPWA